MSPSTFLGGLVVSRWGVLMALAAAAWLAAGELIGPAGDGEGSRPLRAGAPATAVGVAMAAMSFLHVDASAAWVSGAWTVLGLATVLLHRGWPRRALDVLGLGLLGAAALAWGYAYCLGGWSGSGAPPVLHPGLLLAVAWAAAAVGAVRWVRGGGADAGPTVAASLPAALAAAVVVVFLATSLEVARVAALVSQDRTAQMAAVSIWWGVFAVAMIAFGFIRKAPPVRRVGLGVLAVATAKAVFVDLVDVSPAWRIASFVGLGLLMLAVAAGYLRVAARAGGGGEENTDSGHGDGAEG